MGDSQVPSLEALEAGAVPVHLPGMLSRLMCCRVARVGAPGARQAAPPPPPPLSPTDGRPSAQAAPAPHCCAGLVAHWPAVRLWAGAAGVARLVQLAGGARVEAMVSRHPGGGAGPVAIGDMQHLVLLGTTLREFLDGSLQRSLAAAQPPGAAGGLSLYLAQQPLLAAGPGGGAPGDGTATAPQHAALAGLQPTALAPLMQDLGVPAPLAQGGPGGPGGPGGAAAPTLSSVNLWASLAPTRSSLHYDPHHNLLCVARGAKRVRLLPPAATPALRAQPVTHESANHSPADLAAPDGSAFPALPAALAAQQEYEVAAGDALFIPEGWWHQVSGGSSGSSKTCKTLHKQRCNAKQTALHCTAPWPQVDSTGGTLACNWWWEGAVSRQLGGHMDRRGWRGPVSCCCTATRAAPHPCCLVPLLTNLPACIHTPSPCLPPPRLCRYYFRRLVQSLLEGQKAAALAALPRCDLVEAAAELDAAEANEGQQQQPSGKCELQTAQTEQQQQIAAAVRLLAAAVAAHQQAGEGSKPPALICTVAASLAAQSVAALLDALLRLRRERPELAAHLLLHSLDPAAWELLSGCIERRQEELAAEGAAEEVATVPCMPRCS